MTVDPFVTVYEGTEGNYELVDRQVDAMAGGTGTPVDLGLNLATAARQKRAGRRPAGVPRRCRSRASAVPRRYHALIAGWVCRVGAR
jgi:hypothetical protein